MLDIQLDEVPESKLYKTNAIPVATFFGGVFVGAYLLSENFKGLGNLKAARTTWLVAVAAFVFISVISVLPMFANVSSFVYVLAYTWSVSWVARRYQLPAINSHIEKGGQLYSNGRVLVITLIGLAVMFAVVFGLYFVQRAIEDRI